MNYYHILAIYKENLSSLQYETATIPCCPTHPNVTVTLIKQGEEIKPDNKYITYSPKVSRYSLILETIHRAMDYNKASK